MAYTLFKNIVNIHFPSRNSSSFPRLATTNYHRVRETSETSACRGTCLMPVLGSLRQEEHMLWKYEGLGRSFSTLLAMQASRPEFNPLNLCKNVEGASMHTQMHTHRSQFIQSEIKVWAGCTFSGSPKSSFWNFWKDFFACNHNITVSAFISSFLSSVWKDPNSWLGSHSEVPNGHEFGAYYSVLAVERPFPVSLSFPPWSLLQRDQQHSGYLLVALAERCSSASLWSRLPSPHGGFSFYVFVHF